MNHEPRERADRISEPPADLARISSEMRAVEVPQVDAAKIEAALFARIEADRRAGVGARGVGGRLPLLVGGGVSVLALAAAALLAFRSPSPAPGANATASSSAVLTVSGQSPSDQAQPGATKGAGTAGIASGTGTAEAKTLAAPADAELTVVRDGLATLVLEPGSAVRVVRDVEDGGTFEVDLEHGAVRAYVVPRPEKERVIVTSHGARVAVHGTVFRVAENNEATDVDILRGTVAVRPAGIAGQGEEGTQMIDAPRGVTLPLSATGDRDAAVRMRPVRSFVEIAGPWASERPSKPAAVDGSAARATVSNDALRGRVTSIANLCFQKETSRVSAGVDVRVDAALSLTVSPAGRVSGLKFATPLAPGLERCIRGSVIGQPGVPGVVDVPVSLSRR